MYVRVALVHLSSLVLSAGLPSYYKEVWCFVYMDKSCGDLSAPVPAAKD